MENRSLSVAALLIGLACLAGSAHAESEASLAQQADWTRRLDKATELKGQGKAQKELADKSYREKEKRCYEKFRVNACRDEAGREHARLTTEARRQENEGKALERQVKKEQLSDKDERYAAESAARAANLQQREAETAAERQETSGVEAARRADKAKQAEEGRRRRAADAERLQQKRAEHEARVARKIEEARQRIAPAPAR